MTISIKQSVRVLGVAFAVLVMLAIPFVLAPKAQAADYGDGYSYDYFVPDSGSSYDYYVPDSGSSYDYYVPDSGYSGGSTMGGWSSGGGFFGGSTMGGGGYSPSYSSNSSSVFAPTNTCTATNSCNTTTQINAPTTVTTVTNGGGSNSYPVYQPVYSPPVYIPTTPAPYDICPNIVGIQASLPGGYYIQNGYCYQNTIAYQPQPYITLAAVPYTGLELGPVGTAMYWGFLVLWCLIAAYLIVVKKIQNRFVSWLVSGPTVSHTVHAVHTAHEAPAVHAHRVDTQEYSAQFDGIDPFIQSQINRTK